MSLYRSGKQTVVFITGSVGTFEQTPDLWEGRGRRVGGPDPAHVQQTFVSVHRDPIEEFAAVDDVPRERDIRSGVGVPELIDGFVDGDATAQLLDDLPSESGGW
jgi:hypothetical protein